MLDYVAALEELRGLVSRKTGMIVTVGELPAGDGVSLVSAGGQVKYDLAGNARADMQIAVAGKSKIQSQALSLLDEALSAMRRAQLEGYGWQLHGVTPGGAPAFNGQNAAGYYVYVAMCKARVTFWAKEAQ